jgi:hypothetical protein
MLNQRFYRYPSLLIDSLSQYLFIKTYKLNPLFGSIFISFNRTNQIYSLYPLSISLQVLIVITGVIYPIQYIWYRENRSDVKGTYILLSGTLAVVTSAAVRDTTSSSIAVVERSTKPSAANRYPIVDILCLISVEIVYSLLSNIRLLEIDIRPQANASL